MTSSKLNSKGTAPAGRLSGLSLPCLVLFMALFVAFSAVFWTQNLKDVKTASIRPEGDGLYYYVYLRSLIFDRDVDFENDYKLLGNQFRLRKTSQKKAGNIFTIGPAIYWLPFAAIAHATLGIERALGDTDQPINGKSIRYQRIVQFGSLFWGFAALFLVFLFLRRQYGDKIGIITVFGLALATPLTWYMLRQAAYSHAISAFSTAAFVYYWHGTLYRRKLWQWGVLGLLVGLAMLVRPQNVCHAILPLGEWLLLMPGCLRSQKTKDAGLLVVAGIIFVGAAFVTFFPQMAAWNYIYGSYFTIPQEHGGKHFLFLEHSKWSEVLFSSRHGLFAWNPIIYCSVIGLGAIGIFRRKGDMRSRLVPILMLLAIGLQAYVNGTVRDWFGGWAYGGRRFMSCTIYFGLGIAVVLSWTTTLSERLSPLLIKAAPAIVVAVFVAFNLGLMDDYRYSRAKHAASQPMKPAWQRSISDGVDHLYELVGNLGSIPANWLFAVRGGVSPERYDAVSGHELFERRKKASFKFTDKRFTLRGFGRAQTSDDKPCSWVRSEKAVFVISLRKPYSVTGSILLKSTEPGVEVEMKIGTNTVFRKELVPQWQPYPFHIDESILDAGFNYVTVFVRAKGRAETTPGKDRKPAQGVAFSSVTLHRK